MTSKVDLTYQSEEKGILDKKTFFKQSRKHMREKARKKNRWDGILQVKLFFSGLTDQGI